MINYTKVNEGKGWAKGVPFNPTNATTMENGIKAACDGVDRLESVPSDLQRNGSGEVSGGKNLWDEQWELGTINSSGQNAEATNAIRTVNYTKVKANTSYTVTLNNFSSLCVVYFYDANKNQVVYSGAGAYNNGYNGTSPTFVTPSNTAYVRLRLTSTYGTTYKHDIAIIEGTSGTYEPYYPSNLQLSYTEQELLDLKYLGYTVPREYSGPRNYVDGSGTFHQRVGRYDLRLTEWSAGGTNSGVQGYYTKIALPNAKIPANDNTQANIFLNGFTPKSRNAQWNGVLGDASLTQSGLLLINATTVPNDRFVYYELATEVVISEGEEAVLSSVIHKDVSVSSASVAVNGDVRVSVAIPSGYMPMSVVSLTNNNAEFVPYLRRVTDASYTLIIRNTSQSSMTFNANDYRVFMVKN